MKQAFESGRALVAPFLAAAERDPRRVWARTHAGERTLGESRARIAAMTLELRTRALPPGTIVGLVLAPAPGPIEALAAAWCADLVPLLIDPAVPRGLEREIAVRMGARLAWRPAEGWSEAWDARLPLLVTPATPRLLPAAAALKLTSGSSGEPHAVEVGAAALGADTDALVRCLGLRAGERALVAVPLSHSYGFSVLTLPALTHGITLLFPGGESVWSAAHTLEASFLPSVPAWFRSALRGAAGALAPTLRLLVSAGAPLAPEVAREFRARFGRAIHVLYGASECGSITYDREGTAAERGRVGQLLDGVALELEERADDESPGLVCVRSPALGSGYVPERAGDRARLDGLRFRSEDLARWRPFPGQADELELCGRRSDWINVKGHKVDPREVEAVIAAHPRVREVAVIAKPRQDGQDESVRAVIVCEGALGFLDVSEWCRQRLAPHQLPRSVVFVDELPRTERGKLDRAKLLAL